MKTFMTLGLVTVVAAVGVFAQPPAVPQAFEIVSVKPSASRMGIRGHSFQGDRFEAANVPLRDLIVLAYGEPGQLLPDSRLSGGPVWIDSDRFDVSAKIASGERNDVAQKQVMLQTLLAERFKLAVHHEIRALPVYALIAVSSDSTLGPRLGHANIDCEALLAQQPGHRDRCILYALPSGKLMVRGQTMSALASALSRLLDREVLDRTGLVGGFDADADFNPDGLPGMMPSPDVNRPTVDALSLSSAIHEQLGLKLESTRASVDVLVIDHVERPTPN